MDVEELKQQALAEVDGLRDEIIALSRELFENPELSGQEFESVARLREVLERHGFQVALDQTGLPTAFVARPQQGNDKGPRLAFLAEYDALPEIGHGCGHNLIGTAGVFAGIVAGRLATRVGRGAVTVVGTPAEETIGGKVVLARSGLFDEFDAAMMVHPSGEDRAFSTSLACNGIEVEFLGVAAHAVAHPEKGVNALDSLLQLFSAIDAARKAWGPDVKVPGVILEGGLRANIIPERAVGQFTVRAASIARVDEVRAHLERMVEGIAIGTGANYRITDIDNPYFEMVTNRPLSDAYAANLVALGRTPVDGPRKSQGSLDMGNVSYRCPSIHPFVSICGPEMASHTRAFGEATVSERGERALLDSVKALAMTAADLLCWRHLVKEAREAFDEFRAGLPDAARERDRGGAVAP